MANCALNVAKYIISWCATNGAPVSNLKLQKILYFAQGEYYQQTGQLLFDDDFLAWRLGPVVRAVYEEYCSYGASSIYDSSVIALDSINNSIINSIIDRRRHQTAGELVNEAHRLGGAWASVYNGSNSTVIPKALIMQEFPYEAN